MKKALLVSMLTIVLVLGIGCTKEEPMKTVSYEDILENVKDVMINDLKEVGFDDKSFEEEQIPSYIVGNIKDPAVGWIGEEFKELEIENGTVIQAMMNINSDLVILIQVNDQEDLLSIQSTLEEILQKQQDLWSEYLPDQYEKVKNTIITVKEDYVLYATYSDAKKLEDAFLNSFK